MEMRLPSFLIVASCLFVGIPLGDRDAWADNPVPQKTFPVNLVNETDSSRVQKILKEYSLYRENVTRFESTPKVYRYLINRLPLAATLIRILDLGNYKITKNPDGTLTVDNQDGLVLTVRMHHVSETQLVSFVDGVYNSWWTTGIRGRAAIWLRFHPNVADGRPVMENDFVGFIEFPNPVVEFMAKVVDFFLRRMTDEQIEISQNAGRTLTELLAKDPAKVYLAMQSSPEVSAEQRDEFLRTFLLSEASAEAPTGHP
jgi:hypothetical protein